MRTLRTPRGLVGGCVLVGLSLVLVSLASPVASASGVTQTSVDFGVPRTQIVSGLDFEAACKVAATSADTSVIDGQTSNSFSSVSPGACAITVYVLGIPIGLPVLNETPLGRYSFYIPGVSGFTFGLADVSIDLVTVLFANYTGSSPVLSSVPSGLTWSTWGASPVTIAAHSGAEGDSLSFQAPYTLSMTFAVGVSVYVLGLAVWSVNLASLGSIAGTPAVPIPVSVDLRPTRVAVTGGWAPSPYLLQVNWTPNTDTDFSSYRVSVQDGQSGHTYAVDSQAASTLTMPASPGRTYNFTVEAVDQSGMVSTASTLTIRTPSAPTPGATVNVSPAGAPDATQFGVIFVLGLVIGGVVSRSIRPRRRGD